MKILHDIHTHNIYSSCCVDRSASTLAYLKRESELGMRVFGLSNHIWDETVAGASNWYKNQMITRAEEAKNAFDKASPDLRVMFGAESEYFACRDILGMSEEGADHFDYLLFPHSHLHMRNEVMADFPEIAEARRDFRRQLAEKFPFAPDAQLDRIMQRVKEADIKKMYPELTFECKAFVNQAMVDNFIGLFNNTVFQKIIKKMPVSIAHSFSPCGVLPKDKNDYLCLIPDETFEECYRLAAKAGVGIELGLNAIRTCDENLDTNQMMRAYAIAKRVGCKFTFGTDSHTVVDLGRISFGNAVAEKLNLTKNDIAEFVRDGVEE